MLKLELNPKKEHLSHIENWLTEERNESKNGFSTHFNMILKSYTENRLGVLIENETAIGFVVYQLDNDLAEIVLAKIKPTMQKKGFGKKFILDTLELFKSKNVIVVKLFCAPEISQGFWSKCGFKKIDIPNVNEINMYKVLVTELKPCEKTQPDDVLKLWDCEPHLADINEPKWIWNLEYKTDNKTLTNPIVFPAYSEWQLELKKNGIITKDIVKKISFNLCDNDILMIIRKISE